MSKVLMKGNEAIGEAAIRAGCIHFFGYPITPQAELLEWMARRMPEQGRAFVQAESELGAINMALGASAAGGVVPQPARKTSAGPRAARTAPRERRGRRMGLRRRRGPFRGRGGWRGRVPWSPAESRRSCSIRP